MSCNKLSNIQRCNNVNNFLLSSFSEIVDDYIKNHRENAYSEFQFYRQMQSLDEVINKAGSALTQDDKKHPHQYRITNKTLRELTIALRSIDLVSINNFSSLMEVLEYEIRSITGVGDLLIYDTALRIGAFLGYEPDYIYLHAGTKKGARNLGLDYSKGYVETQELPIEFHVLKPREIEDCLCIYKEDILNCMSNYKT